MKKSPSENTVRVNLRIQKEQFNRIKEIASLRRVSLSTLFLSAIEYYIAEGGDKGGSKEYILTLSNSIKNLKVDTEILSEMLSFYIMHYFCYTPELPEVQRKALMLSGKNRHTKFMELLAKRIQGKGNSLGQVINQNEIQVDSES